MPPLSGKEYKSMSICMVWRKTFVYSHVRVMHLSVHTFRTCKQLNIKTNIEQKFCNKETLYNVKKSMHLFKCIDGIFMRDRRHQPTCYINPKL